MEYGHLYNEESVSVSASSGLDLCEFSQKIVHLLTEAARKVLQAPNHEGMGLAFRLLDDARKYDLLYSRTRGICNKELSDAAKKLEEWNLGSAIEKKVCSTKASELALDRSNWGSMSVSVDGSVEFTPLYDCATDGEEPRNRILD